MKAFHLCVIAVGLCSLGLGLELSGQANNERARSELQLGVEAYKQAEYDNAAQHFQLALAADPGYRTARLYLATTMAQQCVPGIETAANDAYCNAAVSQFRFILDRDSRDIGALKAIASLYFNMKKLDEAKEFQHKVMAADPQDPEAPYAIAVLDWTQSYKRRIQAKNHAELKPQDAFIADAGCFQLRQQNLPLVEDGMKMLSSALTLKPDYDDAMAYMNLLYRERADIQCSDQAAYDADVKSADKWVALTMEVKRQKANAKTQAQQ